MSCGTARDVIGGPGIPSILLTGGSGYLGRRVASRLADAGQRTWTLSRGPADPISGQGEQWNPRQPQGLQIWSQHPRTLIHMAGIAHRHRHTPSRREYFRSNVILTRRLAQIAKEKGVKHFILVSSVAVYGPGCTAAGEQQPRRPAGDYGLSKALAEDAVERFADQDFSVTVIRLGTLFGGTDDPGNVGRLARQLQHPLFPRLTTAGNRKCLLWVDDAAEALSRVALRQPAWTYRIFNLAGCPLTMTQVVRSLSQGNRLPKLVPPVPSGLLLLTSRLARHLPLVGRPAARIESMLVKWREEDTFSSREFERHFGSVPTAAAELRLAAIPTSDPAASLRPLFQSSI